MSILRARHGPGAHSQRRFKAKWNRHGTNGQGRNQRSAKPQGRKQEEESCEADF
jgi:hypothetical protein